MFNAQLGLQLYVDDVLAEKEFWSAAGFVIESEEETMGYPTFTMKSHTTSTTTITVYAREFIKQVSPEVIDMKPSILFEAEDIQTLQEKIASLTDSCSPVHQEPFLNFNFASPSGIYFAVKGNS